MLSLSLGQYQGSMLPVRYSGIQPNEAGLRERYAPDGLHPNEAGHEKIYNLLKSFLETL